MIRATFQVRRTRLLCWDVENRPSAYWVPDRPTAQITAVGWKWRHEPEPHAMLLRRDGRFVLDDGRTVSERAGYELVRDLLHEADVSYGHNVRRHDLPLLQSGLLRVGAAPLRAVRTTDTLRDYPKHKDMSASLENLARMYDLGGSKKHMGVVDWEHANRLTPGGVVETRERVVSDVLLQERLRDHLEAEGLLSGPRWWRP